MQADKRNLLLAGTFVILSVLTAMKWNAEASTFVDFKELPKLFPGFTPANIRVIQFSHKKKSDAGADAKEEGLAFQKRDDSWVLASGRYAGLAALGSKIESDILKKLEKIEINTSTVVAQDAVEADLKRYGLDEDSALRVVCGDASGKPLATLLIGRKAGLEKDEYENKVRGTFVRRDNKKTIVLSDEEIELSSEPDEWLNKEMLKVEEAEVAGFTLKNDKGVLEMKREAGKGWKTVKGPEKVGKLRDFAVTGLLSRACSVNAKAIKEGASPQAMQTTGIANAKTQITLVLKDDKKTKREIRIGKRVEGEQEYYAWVDGAQVIFSLPDWDVTEFEKDPKEFFDALPKEEPKKNPQKAPKEAAKKGAGPAPKKGDGK